MSTLWTRWLVERPGPRENTKRPPDAPQRRRAFQVVAGTGDMFRPRPCPDWAFAILQEAAERAGEEEPHGRRRNRGGATRRPHAPSMRWRRIATLYQNKTPPPSALLSIDNSPGAVSCFKITNSGRRPEGTLLGIPGDFENHPESPKSHLADGGKAVIHWKHTQENGGTVSSKKHMTKQ